VSAVRHKVAIGVAAAVGLASAQLFAGIYADPGSSEWPLYYLLVGPVAGLLYYYVAAATLERTILWACVCGFGAFLFSSWFVRPVLYYGSFAASADTGTPQSALEREQWVEALIAAGRYGPPGVSPPMLDARMGDTGTVTARNVGASTVVLSAAIVAADDTASGGWRGCVFTGYAGEGAGEWVELAPGESAVFELEPRCSEIFLDLASQVEFRVGNESVPVAEGWWSTSALVAPHGRAAEGGSGNMALPSSYDARRFYATAGGD
jgi:hypothetical protein